MVWGPCAVQGWERNSVKTYRYIAFAALGLTAVAANAQIVNLANNLSTASINAGNTGSQNLGLFDWRIIPTGPNNVVQQAYAYRVGSGPVDVVNNISAPAITQPTGDLANIGYNSGANFFDINFRYLLTGGAPTSSDLAEVVSVINRGQTALTFSLYEYDFFTPGGVHGGTGTRLNSSTIQLANAAGSITVSAVPIPTHWMIGDPANVVGTIFSGTLSDGSSPFTAADVAFAFQWDVVINPGQTWLMSKDKLLQTAPEPAPLLVLGGLGLLVLRRRRR